MIGHRVVFVGKGQAVVREFEVTPPGAGEVLLENDYTAVSAGTERANLLQLPNTGRTDGAEWEPGYSGAGRVVAVGEGVTNLQVGDPVIVNWGGHRSHTRKKAETILKIADDRMDLLDACFAPIASFSFLGVRKLRIELGESAMVAGMGLLGAFALQLMNLSGAVPVLAADFAPARRKLALQLGAAAAFSPDEDGFVDKVKAAAGGQGPNAVVEVTGAAAALQQALEYIAWEGRISLLGCTRVSNVPIDFYRYVHRRGITLIGAHTFTRARQESAPGRWTELDDYRAFLKLVAANKLQVRPLIAEVVSPAEAPAIYARLAEMKNPPLGIVFDWRKVR